MDENYFPSQKIEPKYSIKGKIELINKNMKQRKIIGYKAPFDFFGGKIKKETVYTYSALSFMYFPIQGSCLCSMPAEIVEKWEAVYEEEKLEIKDWNNSSTNDSATIWLKGGKLTQEIIDKIKEVI